MIDIQKSLKVAMVPIGALIILNILSHIPRYIPFTIIPWPLISALSLLITGFMVVALAWSGFKAVKEAQMSLVGGAVTGGLTGAISGLINAVVNFVLGTVGIGEGNFIGIAGIILLSIIAAVIGLILGTIGAFVAGMKK